MSDLELKFQEVKELRKKRFGGIVLFSLICNDKFTVKRNERCKPVESFHTVVLKVVGNKMYCVDRNAKSTGFIYDCDEHKVVKVTTYEKLKDEVAELCENNSYEKLLAKAEALRAELEKVEAELAKFNK